MDLTVAQRVFVGLAIAAILGAVAVGLHGRSVRARSVVSEPIYTPPSAPAAPATITVHVSGAVQAPGLKVLPRGARVADAISAAGGWTAAADMSQVNLAAPLDDGQRVDIPTRTVANAQPTKGEQPAGVSGPPAPAFPINLNSATAADLEAIPGIGPSLSRAIVEYRRQAGAFRTVEDLEAVPGIGPKRLAQIRPFVTVQ